jgi:hypothetical protein
MTLPIGKRSFLRDDVPEGLDADYISPKDLSSDRPTLGVYRHADHLFHQVSAAFSRAAAFAKVGLLLAVNASGGCIQKQQVKILIEEVPVLKKNELFQISPHIVQKPTVRHRY